MIPSKNALRLFLLALIVAAAASPFFLPAPVADAAGCTACQGPQWTSTGTGLASTCAAARQAAETEATINAFAGGASCIPCQGQMFSYCSDQVVCVKNQGCQFTAFATYTYRCKTCGPF